MSGGSKLKAVIYTRVSTDEQAEHGTSLSSQLEACKGKAEAIGAVVVDHFEDAGVSGGRFTTRLGIQAALQTIENGQANTLIVTCIDRLSRTVVHQAAIKEIVECAGGHLVFCDMNFDESPEGDLAYGVMGVIAEYYRKSFKKKTMAGRRRRALEGIQPCRTKSPYGYHVVTTKDVLQGQYHNEQVGQYVVVEEQAQIVQMIFRQYASGNSLRKIAMRLNDEGVPTAKGAKYWQQSTIQCIIANPVYKGCPTVFRNRVITDESRIQKGFKRHFKTVKTEEQDWVQLEAPPLVEAIMWDACQQRLSENKTLYGGRDDRKHPLSGLIFCPECGRRCIGEHRKRKVKQSTYQERFYQCRDSRPSRNAAGHVCSKRRYSADDAEQAVAEAISLVVSSPEAVQAALQAYEAAQQPLYNEQEYNDLTGKLNTLKEKEMATVKAQIKGIEAGISADVYQDILREIAQQKATLEKRLALYDATQEQTDINDTAAKYAQMLQAVNEVLKADTQDLTPAEKQSWFSMVVQSVYPQEQGFRINLKPIRAQTVQMVSIIL